jgi:hypothetical protein
MLEMLKKVTIPSFGIDMVSFPSTLSVISNVKLE